MLTCILVLQLLYYCILVIDIVIILWLSCYPDWVCSFLSYSNLEHGSVQTQVGIVWQTLLSLILVYECFMLKLFTTNVICYWLDGICSKTIFELGLRSRRLPSGGDFPHSPLGGRFPSLTFGRKISLTHLWEEDFPHSRWEEIKRPSLTLRGN
jgi:hypothetical protein